MKKNIVAIRGMKKTNRSANRDISNAKTATVGANMPPAEQLSSSRLIWHPYAYAIISANKDKIIGEKNKNNIASNIYK